MVALAAASALPNRRWERLGAAFGALLAGLALALEAPLTHPRAAFEELQQGLVAFYEVTLPFDPSRDGEMASLVLVAILASALVVAQLAAAGWSLPAAGVAAASVAWPATLVGGPDDLAYGALALGAALWILVCSRRRPARGLALTAATAVVVVGAAVAVAGSSAGPGTAGLDWKQWSVFAGERERVAVSYVWDANYDGITFPGTATTVLRVRADRRPRYWRASSLDVFSGDRWLESLQPLGTAKGRGVIPADPLRPQAAERRDGWLEQRVRIESLRDTRLVAAGTVMAYDVRTRGATLVGVDGALRVPVGLRRGDRYGVWSYVPDPVPRVLAAARPVYPKEARRYLEAFGRTLPPFGAPGRAVELTRLVGDSKLGASDYAPLYERAMRLAGSEPSPYRVVLAVESWLRREGGFRYDEQPARSGNAGGPPPLVEFVTTNRAGYCQHFAGAMTLMLRLLGIPSRVAVGFTSGTLRDGTWVVTDLDAHAWVEVWFPRYGWIPFDPTPGRGRLTGAYSFASESARAVAELGAGRLPGGEEVARLAETATPPSASASRRPPFVLYAIVLLAACVVTLVLAKLLRTRWRYRSRDPRRRAGAARAELVCFLRDQRLEVGPASTASDLRAVVAATYGVRLDAFTDAFGRARFGPSPGASDAERARRELRRGLAAVRSRLGLRRRVRGALSTRSLRGG